MLSLPWTPGKWTSEAAARAAHPASRGDAFEIYLYGCSRGEDGFTRDEVLARKHLLVGLGKLDSTVTARINGLCEAGCFVQHPRKLARSTRSGNQAEVLISAEDKSFEDYLRHHRQVRQKRMSLAKKVEAYRALCERAAAHYDKLGLAKASASLRALMAEIEAQ